MAQWHSHSGDGYLVRLSLVGGQWGYRAVALAPWGGYFVRLLPVGGLNST